MARIAERTATLAITGAFVLICAVGCKPSKFDDDYPPRFAPLDTELRIQIELDGHFGTQASTGNHASRQHDAKPASKAPIPLGYVRAIAEDRDGGIVAADNDAKDVVHFNASGVVLRVLGSGYGTDSGTFVSPAAVAVDTAGDVSVLDNELRRVTTFDSTGRIRSVVPVVEPSAFGLTVRGSQFWVLRYFGADIPDAVSVYANSGGRLATAFPVIAREKSFALVFPGVIASTSGGTVLFGHPEPGTWSALDPLGHVHQEGEEALPQSRVTTVAIGPRVFRTHTPGGTIAIGEIARDTIGIVYATEYFPDDPNHAADGTEPGPLVLRYYLNEYTSSGHFLGAVPVLPGLRITAAAFGRGDHLLYVGIATPYPCVLRLALLTSQMSARSGGTQ